MSRFSWRIFFIALSMIFVLPLTATVQAEQQPETTEAVSDPRTVRVPITLIDTPGRTGSNGIIKLRLGNSAPIMVMVDTGSVGLRLWSAPTSIAARATTRMETQVGGAVLPALMGNARMTVGTVTTTTAVPFAFINSSSTYIDAWKRAGVSGILGIGIGKPSGTGALTNPLRSLPGPHGQRWNLHFAKTGSLVLGAQPPTDARMHFPLQSAGLDVNGTQLWDDTAAPGCWRFGETLRRCVHTLFDSGFTVMRVKGQDFARVPKTKSDQLKPGTRIQLSASSSAFIGDAFTAGNTESRNFARVISKGKSSVNTGNSYFFRYVVTYNALIGDIYLSTPDKTRINDD
jgi:hypothetical protein